MPENQPRTPLAYSIPQFLEASGLGSRTTVYHEIAEGRLKTIKVGRRRLIPYQAAQDWLNELQQGATQ